MLINSLFSKYKGGAFKMLRTITKKQSALAPAGKRAHVSIELRRGLRATVSTALTYDWQLAR